MAIAFRAADKAFTPGATTATSIAVPKPTGVVDGDFIIVLLNVREVAASVTISAPDGTWTECTAETQTSVGSMTVRAWCKFASSEPSSWTFAVSPAQEIGAAVVAYSGVDTTTPIADSTLNSTSGTTAAASVSRTATAVGQWLVAIRGCKDNAAGITFTPSGDTPNERLDEQSGDAGAAYYNQLHIIDSGSLASTGSKTATSTHGGSPQGSAMAGYLLNPASASATSVDVVPAVLALSGVAASVSPASPDIAAVPATVTLSAPTSAPSPGSPGVPVVVGILTLTGTPPTVGPSLGVPAAPATLNLLGVALSPTPGSPDVPVDVGRLDLSGVPLSVDPSVAVAWSPPSLLLDPVAPTLDIASPSVPVVPAGLQLGGVSTPPAPASPDIATVPASLTFSGALGAPVPSLDVPLQPATLVLEGVAPEIAAQLLGRIRSRIAATGVASTIRVVSPSGGVVERSPIRSEVD